MNLYSLLSTLVFYVSWNVFIWWYHRQFAEAIFVVSLLIFIVPFFHWELRSIRDVKRHGLFVRRLKKERLEFWLIVCVVVLSLILVWIFMLFYRANDGVEMLKLTFLLVIFLLVGNVFFEHVFVVVSRHVGKSK